MHAPFTFEGNQIEHCLSRVWVNKSTEEFCVCVYTGESTYYKIMGTPAAKTVSIFKGSHDGDTYITAAENFYSALAYVTRLKGIE